MVRAAKKKDNGTTSAAEPNPDLEERNRLKGLAFSKKILSETPAKLSSNFALSPSKTVIKHHGKDILKKSQRKNRFLFSFPGLLAPISGGKIGELKDLGTKNPILYLDFPQGQIKLFGTIVYPKNRYLTLQFSRGGKNVMCEDYFDTMIAFSDAWWIGRKDENPEEVRLEFPRELNAGQHAEYDFKGGAGGAACEIKQVVTKPGIKCSEPETPKTKLEDDLSDSENNFKDLLEVTPTRHSARTAGKAFNFVEASSGDDSVEKDTGTSEEAEKEAGAEHSTRNYTSGKTENSCPIVFDIDNEDAAAHSYVSEQVQPSAMPSTKSKELSRSSRRNHSSLVQATIDKMFKVEEKAGAPKKKGKVIEKRKVGTESKARKRQPKVEDDDDDKEAFSSTSEDIDASDEDWAA